MKLGLNEIKNQRVRKRSRRLSEMLRRSFSKQEQELERNWTEAVRNDEEANLTNVLGHQRSLDIARRGDSCTKYE